MNKSPQRPRSLRPLSSELIYVIPFSLIAAHLFVGICQKENYLELFLKPGYWPGFLLSAGIAFLLIVYIKYASRSVYLKADVSQLGKLFLQFVLGILSAVILEFSFSTAYFTYAGYYIFDTVYFDSYFLPIVMYILMMNIWYADGFGFSKKIEIEPVMLVSSEDSSALVADQDTDVPEVKKVALETQKNVAKPQDIAAYAEMYEIGMINTLGPSAWLAKSFENKGRFWFHNLKISMNYLPNAYVQVTRNCIIHQQIINLVNYDMDNSRIFISLKSDFDQVIEVERQYIYSFYEWWELRKPREQNALN